jgi:hypothetical protein
LEGSVVAQFSDVRMPPQQSVPPVKKKGTKWFFMLAATVLGAAVLIYLFSSEIATLGVNLGLPYVFKVQAGVEAVDPHLSEGNLSILKLWIANAPGYSSNHLLEIDDVSIRADAGSFLTQDRLIHLAALKGIRLVIERDSEGGLNYNLAEKVAPITRRRREGAAARQTSRGGSLTLKRLVLQDLRVTFPTRKATSQIEIERLELNNIRAGQRGLAGFREVLRQAIGEIMRAAPVFPESLLSGSADTHLDKPSENRGSAVREKTKATRDRLKEALRTRRSAR